MNTSQFLQSLGSIPGRRRNLALCMPQKSFRHRLLTALAASNNEPATCVMHNHTSVYDIPRVSICSTGYTPGKHMFNWAFGCARPFGWGPPTTGRPHRLVVSANAKMLRSLLTLPQHIFILPGICTITKFFLHRFLMLFIHSAQVLFDID